MKRGTYLYQFTARLGVIVTFAVLFAAPGGGLSQASARPLAATSPTLGPVGSYSVLAGSMVTCSGATTVSGDVGVSPGTAITGFPTPCSTGSATHSNDASAMAAQANNLVVFGTLDQPCDQTFGAVDLTATFPSGVGPGVYCSTSSFTLTGNLNLTGSGVWIFKTVSSLITSPGSSVTGGDPCNVWWRIGSSATLDTTTSFIGNIFALTDISLNSNASLNGRALVQTGQVSLSSNTIHGPVCLTPASPTPTSTPTATPSQGSGGSAQGSSSPAPVYSPISYIQYQIAYDVTALSSPNGSPATDSSGPIVLKAGAHWYGSPTLVLGNNGQYYVELFLGGPNHVFIPVGAVVNGPMISFSATSAPTVLPMTGYPPTEQLPSWLIALGTIGLLFLGISAWKFRRTRLRR